MHLAYNKYINFLATSIIDKVCVNKPDIPISHIWLTGDATFSR